MSLKSALENCSAAIEAVKQIQPIPGGEITAEDKRAILLVLGYAMSLLAGAKLADPEIIARIKTGAPVVRDPADIYHAAPGETDELLLRWSGKLTRDEMIRHLCLSLKNQRENNAELYAELRAAKVAS